MKTQNLSAPEALAALMEGKKLKGHHTDAIFELYLGNYCLRRLDGFRPGLTVDDICKHAPYTIIEDEPKQDELPEYLERVIDELPWRVTTREETNKMDRDLSAAILRAVDERIKASHPDFINNHLLKIIQDCIGVTVDQGIAKAIEEHDEDENAHEVKMK